MNFMMWIVAGGAIGWMRYAFFKANSERGAGLSIIIGAIGGMVGGGVLAPMLGGMLSEHNEFSPFALFVALASAIGCLIVRNMFYRRFGV
jgi:uncharacterized membrane protein YeaQ/YmgE (transglycosylase-associated protein family)